MNNLRRGILIGFLALGCGLSWWLTAAPTAPPPQVVQPTHIKHVQHLEQPNLIVVLADDLGWGDVGYHGGEAKTPNIDRISSQGVRFERFYVQALCTPTRAALLTGRYPWRFGMASGVLLNHIPRGLPLDEITLPEVLHTAGYKTAIVGKWHLGHFEEAYLPTNRGFDYHYGLYTAIDHFTHMWDGGLDWHRNAQPVREKGYATDLLGDDSVRVIEEHDFSTQPLFLYYPMFAVHAFNQAPARYTDAYDYVKDPDRRGLLGLIAAMDLQFGRLVQALDDAGQLDNSLILFVSDNGGSVIDQADNGALRGAKGTYYEGGVRVPAFAYWPGKIAPGQRSAALNHVTDIFPTLVQLAGATMPAGQYDGFSLNEIMFHGAESSGRTKIPFILDDSETLGRGAMISWPWKYLRTKIPGKPWVHEIYNIENDPNEKANVAEQRRPLVSRLFRELQTLKIEADTPYWNSQIATRPRDWKAPAVIGPPSEQPY